MPKCIALKSLAIFRAAQSHHNFAESRDSFRASIHKGFAQQADLYLGNLGLQLFSLGRERKPPFASILHTGALLNEAIAH